MTKKKEHEEQTQAAQDQREKECDTPQAQENAKTCEKETHHKQDSAPKQDTQDKAEEYYQQLLRLQADFENYRKRTEKEKPLFIEYGRAEVIKSLLGLYDTLLKAQEETQKEGADINHIKQGLKMIFDEFNKVFTAQGVCVVCSKGKPYDPMTQEAVTTIPCEEKDDCMVIEELKKGVTLDGKVIRPAQVIVGKKKEAPVQEKN